LPYGTEAQSVNPSGEVTGITFERKTGYHGFIRDKNGTITTFDAVSPFTFPISIDPKGVITGFTAALNSTMTHGFVIKMEASLRSTVPIRLFLPA
jgi:hypothetical protein